MLKPQQISEIDQDSALLKEQLRDMVEHFNYHVTDGVDEAEALSDIYTHFKMMEDALWTKLQDNEDDFEIRKMTLELYRKLVSVAVHMEVRQQWGKTEPEISI